MMAPMWKSKESETGVRITRLRKHYQRLVMCSTIAITLTVLLYTQSFECYKEGFPMSNLNP